MMSVTPPPTCLLCWVSQVTLGMEECIGSPLLTLPPPHAVWTTDWVLEPGGCSLSRHSFPFLPFFLPRHGSVLGIGNSVGSALTAEGLGANSAAASSPRPLRGQEGRCPVFSKLAHMPLLGSAARLGDGMPPPITCWNVQQRSGGRSLPARLPVSVDWAASPPIPMSPSPMNSTFPSPFVLGILCCNKSCDREK